MCEREINFLFYLKKDYENSEEKIFKEVSALVEEMVNGFGLNFKELVGLILLDEKAVENMDRIAASWLRVLRFQSLESYHYDGRNQYSVMQGEKLSHNPFVLSFAHEHSNEAFRMRELNKRPRDRFIPLDIGSQIAAEMFSAHRTLQQSFSGLVFTYLVRRVPESSETFDVYDWWRCPLI